MFKNSNLGIKLKSVVTSVPKISNVVAGPFKRYFRSLLFALLLETIGMGTPARKWLAVVMYPSLQVASKVKWGITGYALYLFFYRGIHMPFWLTALSLFTSVLLVVALAAAKMEFQHHGYLSSK
ncbi:hypothetical protein ABH908_000451 [Pseudomonas frederiksbergensis]|uniref:hypothetical protein n=1 Tax=Pseudomonas TaxID=286 RepID=UPI003D1B3C68